MKRLFLMSGVAGLLFSASALAEDAAAAAHQAMHDAMHDQAAMPDHAPMMPGAGMPAGMADPAHQMQGKPGVGMHGTDPGHVQAANKAAMGAAMGGGPNGGA